MNSQNTYPKKIVFDNDTCVAISIPQLKLLNSKLANRKHLRKNNLVLIANNEKYQSLIKHLNDLNESRDKELAKMAKSAIKIDQHLSKEMQENDKLREKVWRSKRREHKLLGVITALVVTTLIGFAK